MDCKFAIGQKVVCVNDQPDAFTRDIPGFDVEWVGDLDGLVAGKIYTIRDIYCEEFSNGICIRLEEIYRVAEEDDIPDPGFFHERFRLLKDTRNEMFNNMIKKALASREELV